MKKTIFLLSGFLCSIGVLAQSVTLSQSLDPTSIEASAVMCWSNFEDHEELEDGWSDENFFARVYALAEDHGITEDFLITSVEVGQRFGSNKLIDINIYETDNLNPNQGERILVASETIFVIPQSNDNILSVATSALIPEGKFALIEVFVPAGVNETGSFFFIGRNSVGQIRQSWLKTAPCGLGTYLNPSQIGFGPQEYVLNITGETTLSVRENEAIKVELYPNPTTDFIGITKPSNVLVKNLKVIDMNGKVLVNSPFVEQLDLRDLATGNYLVQFQTENGAFSKKIIKK